MSIPMRLPAAGRLQRRLPTLAAVLALISVAGCGPLLQIGGNDKAPMALLSLRAMATPVAGPASIDPAKSVLVLTPSVPGPLQTLRLPVATHDTEIAYLTGATWAEPPNRQFQRVLADTIEARGIIVLDPRQSNLAQGRTLSGTLMDFSLDVRNPAAPVVRVRYDAALTGKNQTALDVRRFDQVVPVSSQLPGDVGIALNQAANAVANDVAAWVAR